MATFLQLAQKVAAESGTISGATQPSSVVGQTGRLLKVVNWTADAWRHIQNMEQWRFLHAEFTGTTTAGAARYTGSSFLLSDHAEWVGDHPGYKPMTAYKQSVGVTDERPLMQIDWYDWRQRYGRGDQVQNAPSQYAISPANELVFGPIPDATYVIRGEYVRTPQVLAADGDIPWAPSRFHDAIVWEAIRLLASHDEAEFPIITATQRRDAILSAMRRDQLPPMGFSGPSV